MSPRRPRWSPVLLAIASLSLGTAAFAQATPSLSASHADFDGMLALVELANAGRLAPVQGGWTAVGVAEAAVARAPRVAQAQAAIEGARDARDEASLGLLPRLDLSGTYTRTSVIDLPPLSFGGQTVPNPFPQINNLWGLRATVTLPVSDWFLRVLPARESARLGIDVADWQREVAEQDAAWQAQQVYYGWLIALGSIDVADDAVEAAEAHLRDIQAMKDAGLATDADVAQVERAVATAESQRISATAESERAASQLRILLGLPSDAPLQPGEDVLSVQSWSPEPVDALVAAAQRDRSEVLALRTALQQIDEQQRVVRAGAFPALSVQANVDLANPNQRFNPQDEVFRTTWDATAAVSWSPNSLAAAGEQAEQLEAQRLQVLGDLQLAEDGIATEAQAAWLAWSENESNLRWIQQQRVSVETEFAARRELARAGVEPANALTDALLVLAQVRFAEVQALIQQRVTRARIERVLQQSAPFAGWRVE